VIHRTPSWTEAFRVARRRTGGRVDIRQRPDFGVTVIGSLGACTVIAVAGKPSAARPHGAGFSPHGAGFRMHGTTDGAPIEQGATSRPLAGVR
jgi:hypothetical protein